MARPRPQLRPSPGRSSIQGHQRKKRYVYLHSAVDGFTRIAYTEPLRDKKAATAVGFMHRARVWFAAHGISHIEGIVTDDGACYRADAFRVRVARSQT